ncbi:MAG: hypothetical protein AAFY28_01295, partial [Actinomycetota bacterium]
MSTDSTPSAPAQGNFLDFIGHSPDEEMAVRGADVPAAGDLELADLNPLNPHLFAEHRWHEHFARLRAVQGLARRAQERSTGRQA